MLNIQISFSSKSKINVIKRFVKKLVSLMLIKLLKYLHYLKRKFRIYNRNYIKKIK